MGPLDSIDWKKCRNDSGIDLPPFSVLMLNSYETKERATVRIGTKPTTSLQRDYIVTGPYKINSGKYGLCFPPGEVIVRYDEGTPSIGHGYGFVPEEVTLSRYYPQLAICRGVVSSTDKLMLALWLPIQEVFVQAQSNIAKGASGNCDVLTGAPGSEDTSANITLASVYSPYADFNSGILGQADWVNGYPVVHAAACPPPA